jgi:hypothetical protein
VTAKLLARRNGREIGEAGGNGGDLQGVERQRGARASGMVVLMPRSYGVAFVSAPRPTPINHGSSA